MRWQTLVGLLVGLLFLMGAVAEVQAQGLVGSVHRARLNVRAKPTSTAAKLYTLQQGQQVTVLGSSRDKRWYKVQFRARGGKLITGWASDIGLTVSRSGKAVSSGSRKRAIVNRPRLNVRSRPASKAKKLYTLREGKQVKILKQTGKWYRVNFKTAGGRSLTGWTHSMGLEMLAEEPAMAAAPPAEPAAPPFEPEYYDAEPEQPLAPAPVAPPALDYEAPAGDEEYAFEEAQDAPEDTRPSAEEKVSYQDDGEDEGFTITPRLGLDFVFQNYKLTGTVGGARGKILSYNLPGYGADIGADAYFLTLWPGKSRLGVSFNYQFVYYLYDIGLNDAAGAPLTAQGGSVSKSGTSNKINGFVNYRFNLTDAELPPRFTFHAGYEYYKFNGGDLSSDAGQLFLVVDQKVTSFLLGFDVSYPLKPVVLSLFFDYYLLPSYSENAENPSGSVSSEGIFLNSGIGIAYWLMENFALDLKAGWKMMNVDFSGPGRRILNDFTDGSATTNMYWVSIGANYSF